MYFKIILGCFFVFSHIMPWYFQVQPLHEILKNNPSISYIHVADQKPFNFKKHPFYLGDLFHPYSGSLEPTFILKIPNGIAHSQYGWVLIDNCFIREMIWKYIESHLQYVDQLAFLKPKKIEGSVVVLGQMAYFNYYHMLSELFCRLAMIEMQNIPYDKVYVPQTVSFLKNAMLLWGIKKENIIDTFNETYSIQADTLILPSLVSNIDQGFKLYSCYPHADLLQYVRTKFLNNSSKQKSTQFFSKKIFISRKDSPNRKIINEEEIQTLLEKHGFASYVLSSLSVADQIKLFHNADIIIGAQGTSLANCMFCKPGTKIIELFQQLSDTTIAFLSEIFDLRYIPIQTTQFNYQYDVAIKANTFIPMHIIQDLLSTL